MTIKSEIYKGKIYAGSTQLASTIAVLQTGAMQLTIKAGTFTHTNGNTWTLATDAVFNLASSPSYPTLVRVEIGDNGSNDVWCGTCVMDGVEEFDPPIGWNKGQDLVFNFSIPAGCTDLTPIDIFALTVLPGFPEGTAAADWQTQRGAV